ncbi:MAG: PQQ-binding-like beta-propeller repeat protein, partial [Planctomycetota bacterium]
GAYVSTRTCHNDPVGCLGMLEIHKDFQTRMFLLDNGRTVAGLVIDETPTEYHVLPNPLEPKAVTKVQKTAIEEKKLSKVSTMPHGLLDTFSRAEILSLVAFLQSDESVEGESYQVPLSNEMRSRNWHQWRGPESNGVSRTATPPKTWSETENVKWRAAIEGSGGSTPIVWEDKIFLLTAINTGEVDPSLPKPEDQPKRVFGIKFPNTRYEFVVLCLDRETGKEIWRRTATTGIPHEGHHSDNDFASASPVTDGENLYCWFGSAGLFCFDLNGNKIWQRNLGKAYMGASLGEGCSPVLRDGFLAIVRDHSRQSMIHVIDAKNNGKTLWEKKRDEPNAWATPYATYHSGRTQLITAASNKIRSYDLYSGEIIWECGGLTGNVIPCPVVEEDLVYCMSGYEGFSLLALPLNSLGSITPDTAAVWRIKKDTPYIPSPLLYDGRLFFTKSNQAILTCVDSRTGKPYFGPKRLPNLNGLYASPVAADGRVYITGRRGMTLVLENGNEFKLLAKNKVDDLIDSSVALAGSQLFLRGQNKLYCIEEK